MFRVEILALNHAVRSPWTTLELGIRKLFNLIFPIFLGVEEGVLVKVTYRSSLDNRPHADA